MGLNDLPKEFRGKGLRLPVAQKRRRLVAMAKADTKTGKTRLLYTMPRPMLQISFDLNSEGQEDAVVESGEEGVFIYEVRFEEEVDGPKELAVFKQIRQFVYDAVETKYFRSIGIDTGDALWTLCQRGFFGKAGFGAGGNQFNYGVPNGAMEKIFKTVRESHDVNFLVVQRVKDEYEEVINPENNKKTSKATGRKVMMGWKQTPFEVNAVIELDKDRDYVCDKPKCKGPKGCILPDKHSLNRYSSTVVDSQYGAEGSVLRGEDITFANIAMSIYPVTQDNPELWQ